MKDSVAAFTLWQDIGSWYRVEVSTGGVNGEAQHFRRNLLSAGDVEAGEFTKIVKSVENQHVALGVLHLILSLALE